MQIRGKLGITLVKKKLRSSSIITIYKREIKCALNRNLGVITD